MVTGWGNTQPLSFSSKDFVSATVLQYLEVRSLSNEECSVQWDRALTADHLCVWTREPGRAACQGDSGGPLTRVTNITSYQRQLLGVISLGPSVCGAGTFPVIVSRLQGDLLDWVNNLIHDK